ncbi:glycosyltransferase family 2 protein [Polynucleobacter sp. MG-5-Ahmo-C2]|uniref:glycosyltransferase family 2 protein n=1 Tax=unclassified Polynucleobacter TaxID=2640945 RepID=UPI001BFE9C21|nr:MULTISPECIES: glycosyltransferase family 2 protein [unclassified Polynucleobacter]QWD72393.1 glycosyltransferase family 2 protein [Polynucleobacter sp. UB-Raua-W9]QWD98493.1 glycosyltransferase family 2 protein [Polynucleobacter sp. MG-5-Ahmo-C2]
MITVVIASYRYGHLAAHCIESLLSQTISPARILFVDDGGFDCNHLPALYPDIEYVLRDENLGVVDNFQDMLSRVNTEYVLFIGADNWLRSDAIEMLSNASADIVTYDVIVTGELKKDILMRIPIQAFPHQGDLYWNRQEQHHGSMMYRTALGQKIGYKKRYEDGAHPQEDWNLWDKMLEQGASVASIKEGLLFYRRHRENFLKYSHEIFQIPELEKSYDFE